MNRPFSVLAAHEASAETPRDGLVVPTSSTAPSDDWVNAVRVASDRESLAMPFFDTLGAAARHAAQLVVIYEFFGCRVHWAAVTREHCCRYRAAVSVEPDPTRCDALDVLLAAARGFDGVSRAGVALHWDDLSGQFGNVEHTENPDSAARRLVESVLSERTDAATLIATRLMRLQPLKRAELLGLWDVATHDPHVALLRAADRDSACEWPMTDEELPGI